MNKKISIILIGFLLITGTLSISGCTTTQESCPNCGSSNVEIVKNYTNNTTGKVMLVCECNNCGYSFEVETLN
jgi:DNA-directed RNA polymerase subunit M/transcription elongation factor TFIIS